MRRFLKVANHFYVIYRQRCRKHFESGGCISTFFLIFWQFQKVGGVTKSRPIDPFLDVIYLFLNVRFETIFVFNSLVTNFSLFGCHHLYVLNVLFGAFCCQLKFLFFFTPPNNLFTTPINFFYHPPL